MEGALLSRLLSLWALRMSDDCSITRFCLSRIPIGQEKIYQLSDDDCTLDEERAHGGRDRGLSVNATKIV